MIKCAHKWFHVSHSRDTQIIILECIRCQGVGEAKWGEVKITKEGSL